VAYHAALEALGSPTRCLILERLRRGPTSVGAIAADIGASQPAVSQHLKVLKEAGLVQAWGMGRKRMYEINESGFAGLRAWINTFDRDKPRSGKARRKG